MKIELRRFTGEIVASTDKIESGCLSIGNRDPRDRPFWPKPDDEPQSPEDRHTLRNIMRRTRRYLTGVIRFD